MKNLFRKKFGEKSGIVQQCCKSLDYLSSKTWLLTAMSAFSVLWVRLLRGSEGNPSSSRWVFGKEDSILIAFSGDGDYFLLFDQNSASDSFLQIGCNLEVNHLRDFSYSDTLDPLVHRRCDWIFFTQA